MVYDGDGFIGTLGERIRFFRTRKKMTQKQLAELCGVSEPAIRNYELGNRVPDYDTMNDIAAALDISYFALADPDCSYLAGAAQALFKMEYCYGLRPVEVDGKAVLSVEPVPGEPDTPLFQMVLDSWLSARKKLENGEITMGEYHDALYRYPSIPLADPSGDEVIQEGKEQVRVPEKKKRLRKKKKDSSSDQ